MCLNCQPSRLDHCSNYKSNSKRANSVQPNLANDATVPDDFFEESDHVPSSLQGMAEISANDNLPPSLPPYSSAISSNNVWNYSSSHVKFSEDVDLAYNEIVHWKQNLFMVPLGKIGQVLTDKLFRLLLAYEEGNNLQKVALRCAMVLPAFLLQKPSKRLRCRDHVSALLRRLEDWKEGKILTLLHEGHTIQQRLDHNPSHSVNNNITKKFSRLMCEGKLKQAL